MADIVVTIPKWFWFDWILEGGPSAMIWPYLTEDEVTALLETGYVDILIEEHVYRVELTIKVHPV